ncbi:lipase 3-like [Monomorium pharaonis]|uniref:lipase 3-like n=1 Tax=Monomorium pharaonis TaxID=307658 RepID=UPI0017467883|nr:lipase 3-like [Monomorium pharaonis]
MQLPIVLLFIVASASAMPHFSSNELSNILSETEKIPWIEELDDPKLWTNQKSLTTMDLFSQYGYNGELHKVMTTDGYILELHRITGRGNSGKSQVGKPVALVMHGLLCSSACWAVSEKGLAYVLADAGYDVWLGNSRGNVYAREHALPDIREDVFWDFR